MMFFFISSSSLVNLFVFYIISIFFLCLFDLASSLFIFYFLFIPISSSHYLFISQLFYKEPQPIIFIFISII
jgi:hypothetical protein